MEQDYSKLFSNFKLPNAQSSVHENGIHPEVKNSQKPKIDKAFVNIGAALGVAALAIASIKLGPKAFKHLHPQSAASIKPKAQEAITNTVSEAVQGVESKAREAVTNVIHETVQKAADVPETITGDVVDSLQSAVQKSEKWIEDPVEYFRETLRRMCRRVEGVDVNNIAEPEILKNGSRRFSVSFVDEEGLQNKIKFVVDKDNNFVSLFHKSQGKQDSSDYRALAKYSIEGFRQNRITTVKDDGLIRKNYFLGDNSYNKKTILDKNGKKLSQKLTDISEMRNHKPMRDTEFLSDISGKDIRIVTDYTQGEPQRFIKVPGGIKEAGEIKIFQTPEGGIGAKNQVVNVIRHNKDGKIISQTESTVANFMQDVNALKLDLDAQLDVRPARSYVRTGREYFKANNMNPQTQPELYSLLKENADLTFDSKGLDIFKGIDSRPYDIPYRFAIIADNTARKNGTALICNDVPKIFEGIEPSKIQKALDKFSLLAERDKVQEFEIAGKKFRAKYIAGGCIGDVYKIEDAFGNAVAMKKFRDPLLMGLQGGYGEIAIADRLTKDGVVDVAKMYMANPVNKFVQIGENGLSQGEGGWMISDFIKEDTPLQKGGKTFFDWLKEHKLIFGDYNAGSQIGSHIVDVGGVTSKNLPKFMKSDDFLLPAFNKGMNTAELAKALEDAAPAAQKTVIETTAPVLQAKIAPAPKKAVNPVETFKEKLQIVLYGQDEVNPDNISAPKILKNGNKRYEYLSTDSQGITHRVRFVTDKDDNFVSLFKKTFSKDGEYELTKYDKFGIAQKRVKNFEPTKYLKHKSYTIGNDTYWKKTYINEEGKTFEAVEKLGGGLIRSKAVN